MSVRVSCDLDGNLRVENLNAKHEVAVYENANDPAVAKQLRIPPGGWLQIACGFSTGYGVIVQDPCGVLSSGEGS